MTMHLLPAVPPETGPPERTPLDVTAGCALAARIGFAHRSDQIVVAYALTEYAEGRVDRAETVWSTIFPRRAGDWTTILEYACSEAARQSRPVVDLSRLETARAELAAARARLDLVVDSTVDELLGRGTSVRETARLMGMSKSSVQQVADRIRPQVIA